MSSFEYGFPDVAYSKEDRAAYEWLKENENSPFYGYTMADIFIFAMSYAFDKKMERKPLSSPEKNMPADVFKPEMRNLMRAVAISAPPMQIDVIKEHSIVVKICEEFANAAISELYNIIRNREIDTKGEQILDNLIREAALTKPVPE